MNAAARLRLNFSTNGPRRRVVASITLPNLFESQLIVFFGEDYWSRFFDRRGPEQKWTPISGPRSIAREWQLDVPGQFAEQGFEELIEDEGYRERGEVWFIGDLDPAPNLPLQPTSGARERGDSKQP